MKAVITVVGKDRVGILATATARIAESNANILEVSQTILDEYFTTIIVVDIDKMNCDLPVLAENMRKDLPDMEISVMHEDTFNAMHRV
ncbi:MAG: ACT domain-containing protein [Anaerovoracaceae bacterium]|jgi:ACT domain-containing protein